MRSSTARLLTFENVAPCSVGVGEARMVAVLFVLRSPPPMKNGVNHELRNVLSMVSGPGPSIIMTPAVLSNVVELTMYGPGDAMRELRSEMFTPSASTRIFTDVWRLFVPSSRLCIHERSKVMSRGAGAT